MPDQPRKPAGEIGAVQFGPTMPEPVFTPVPFPTVKAEIERLVAEYFVADVRAKGVFAFDLGPPEQNAEDDLDFTINTNHGRLYLELTEVHLRGLSEELPTGQYAYESYAVAERVWKQIHVKSERYQGATRQPIILLLYVTHWQFCLSDHVFRQLAYRMTQSPPVFFTVFYMSFLEAAAVETVPLYPVKYNFSGYEPASEVGRVDFLLNPRGWQIRTT